MMESRAQDRELLSRYLLGELEAEDVERVAERTFMDRDYFDLLEEVKEDLTEDYVHGTLTPIQRRHFDANYLVNDERRKDVQIAYLLAVYRKHRSTSPAPSQVTSGFWALILEAIRRQKPTFRFAVACTALLSIVLPALLVWMLTRADRVTTVAGLMTPEINAVRDRGAVQVLPVESGSDTVAIFLSVPSARGRFKVEVQQGPSAVWRQAGVSVASLNGDSVIVVFIPRITFEQGKEYVIAWQDMESKVPAESVRYRIHLK